MDSNAVAGTEPSYFVPNLSKEFFPLQATMGCEFTLILVGDMIGTSSQMHGTDKYSQHSSIISPIRLNS